MGGSFNSEPMATAAKAATSIGTWHGVLSLMLLVFAVLIPFVGIEELGRVIGEGKLKKLFFQRRPLESETS